LPRSILTSDSAAKLSRISLMNTVVVSPIRANCER
jgi:hypothetical protein